MNVVVGDVNVVVGDVNVVVGARVIDGSTNHSILIEGLPDISVPNVVLVPVEIA